MEATLDLAGIFEEEVFTRESYDAIKELAFAGTEPFNRFLELLHDLEANMSPETSPPAVAPATAGLSPESEPVGHTGQSGNRENRALKLGMCYLLLAKPAAAVAWLREAADSAERSYFLGLAHLEQRRYSKADAAFEAAARQGWDSLECHCLRAECFMLAGEGDKAAEIVEAHAAAGETSPDWHCANGCLCQWRGDVDAAVEHFERALALDGEHARSMFQLAYLLDLHGSDERAMELYSTCAKLPVVHSNALMNLAILLEDIGNYESAGRCLRRILAVDPENPRARLFFKDVQAAREMFIDEQQMREDQKRNAVLDIPVTDFELSVRSRNCLKKMNIHYLGDLLRASESELLAYKNFGETSLKEIKAMLAQKSLTVGQYAKDGPPDEETTPTAAPAPAAGAPELLARPVSALALSVRSRKCLQRLGIMTIGDLAAKTEVELLESRNFGHTSLSEIKARLVELGVSLGSAG